MAGPCRPIRTQAHREVFRQPAGLIPDPGRLSVANFWALKRTFLNYLISYFCRGRGCTFVRAITVHTHFEWISTVGGQRNAHDLPGTHAQTLREYFVQAISDRKKKKIVKVQTIRSVVFYGMASSHREITSEVRERNVREKNFRGPNRFFALNRNTFVKTAKIFSITHCVDRDKQNCVFT